MNDYYNDFYGCFVEKLKNANYEMRDQDIDYFVKRFLLEGVIISTIEIEYFEYFTKTFNSESELQSILENIKEQYSTHEWVIGQYRFEDGQLIVPLLKCSKEKIIGGR